MADNPIVEMKRCSKCGETKGPAQEYLSPLKKAKDGLHSWCKPCLAEFRRKDRADRPDHYRAIEQRRYERHRDARLGKNADYRQKNRSTLAANMRDRWRANAIEYNSIRREKFAADPVARQERSSRNKQWREENADQHRERRAERWRRATPVQRLRSYFGSAIYHALRGTGKGGRSWQALVGYTADDLRRHIERQFSPGMSWDNYGEWHIDHILPASGFHYQCPLDDAFKACWAMSNLRPMWASDNIRKRDQRLHLI